MKKVLFGILVLALCAVSPVRAEETQDFGESSPTPASEVPLTSAPASEQNYEDILRRLEEIQKTQNDILKELAAMKEELYIVKVRASQS